MKRIISLDHQAIHRRFICCDDYMIPVKRLEWQVNTGVRHVHVCGHCGQSRIETEYQRALINFFRKPAA